MSLDRKMPERVRLGHSYNSTMAHCMGQERSYRGKAEFHENPFGYRVVMGFFLPSWQRGLVWTQDQKIKFIESAWLGTSLGTYTYNQAAFGSPYDNLLIDGQQRMSAIESYINDEFPVFGWKWSETTEVDKRIWTMTTIFSSYMTETEDEEYLKNYYNLMNFGGTAHKESEKA